MIAIGVLFMINLLNYMDRFTVAGVLTEIQIYFGINDSYAGLLQTVFIIFFMLFAPLCGFMGDRYNRKSIMIGGLVVWVGAVLASSFVPEEVINADESETFKSFFYRDFGSFCFFAASSASAKHPIP